MAGIGAGVAGGFTVHQLITIYEARIPIIDQKLVDAIALVDGNLVAFTQVSAGLAIGVAGLGLILAVIILRICKFNSGGTGTLMLCTVRVTHTHTLTVQPATGSFYSMKQLKMYKKCDPTRSIQQRNHMIPY